ncbi:MAG TPA: hypothetical protein VK184_18835, partial [Nostocaceae cyanobacterium]|nr:hypothetical protein [Nostocaceae cyanobacterium]
PGVSSFASVETPTIQTQLENNNTPVIQRQIDNSTEQTGAKNNSPVESLSTASQTPTIQTQLNTDEMSINSSVNTETSTIQKQVDNSVKTELLETTNVSGESSVVAQAKLEKDNSAEVVEGLPTVENTASEIRKNREAISTNTEVSLQPKNNVIQAKQEAPTLNQNTEIPQLPKVLQNLSVFNPLSEQSKFITSGFANQNEQSNISTIVPSAASAYTPIQRSPVSTSTSTSSSNIQRSVAQEAPSSWSSIADLIGSNTNSNSNMFVQAQKDEQEKDDLLTSFAESPIEYNPSPVKSIVHKSNNSNGVIQKSEDDGNSSSGETTETSGTASSEQGDKPSEKDMDALAREVYKNIQRRLQIEKERQGKNYSGRLPW